MLTDMTHYFTCSICDAHVSFNGGSAGVIILLAASYLSSLTSVKLKLSALQSTGVFQRLLNNLAHFFICFILAANARIILIHNQTDTSEFDQDFWLNELRIEVNCLVATLVCSNISSHSQFLMRYYKGVMCEGKLPN